MARVVKSWIWVGIMFTFTHIYRSGAFQFRSIQPALIIRTTQARRKIHHVNPYHSFRQTYYDNNNDDSWKRLHPSFFSTNKDWDTIDMEEDHVVEEEEDDDDDWRNNNNLEVLPKGVPDGFYIIQQYPVPTDGFSDHDLNLQRIEVDTKNVTLPLALTILDPQTYPSFSRARKACRYVRYILYYIIIINVIMYSSLFILYMIS